MLLPSAVAAERRWLTQLKRAGKIRSVGPRLYVSVPEARTVETIRATWMTIVATLFPRALISHRTALDLVSTPDGDIFLTGGTNRAVHSSTATDGSRGS